MYSPLVVASKFAVYWLTASNGKGHGIHSPFVFELIERVFNDTTVYPEYEPLDRLRKKLRADKTLLPVEDFGAGSVTGAGAAVTSATIRNATGTSGVGTSAGIGNASATTVAVGNPSGTGIGGTSAAIENASGISGVGTSNATQNPSGTRTVAAIARGSAKSRKYARLLFRMVKYYRPAYILELGTSLGLSTAHLAAAGRQAVVISGEGNAALAARAEAHLLSLGLDNCRIVTGNFDTTLPQMMAALPQIDLAFIDGNHREEPTLRYFHSLLTRVSPSSVMIFDDIHWSAGMESAWETIKAHPSVMLTVDLFFMGLVFFRPEFKVKQHFLIRF